MKRICQLCGTEYETKSSRSKYCRRDIIKKCKACGKEFKTQCFKGNPEYCSRQCAASAVTDEARICITCGKEFIPANNNQRYCSAKCHKKHLIDLQPEKPTRICRICGQSFIPRTNTHSICDRDHKFKCVICGSEFIIPKNHLTEPKLRQTCSDECKRKLMSQNNKGSTEESVAKRKATCLERYGVEHAAQSPIIQQKMHQTYQNKTGFMHPSHNPEVRKRSAKSAKTSKLESKICDLFNNYDIEYVQHYMLSKNEISHEFDFYLPKYKILIDADGVYFHSYLSDPDGKHSIDYYDDIRVSLVPEDHQFYVIVEGTEERTVKQIVGILQRIDDKLFDYDSYLFNWCRSIEFPYPEYSEKRIKQDWSSLCKYENDKYTPQCRIGESAILNFHRSLYDCKVKGYDSPVEAWYNDTKLKKVIKNRLIYANDVDPSKILRGFNVSKICPRVSVFNPVLAKYLVTKYLSDYSEIFDPFSGFSGRLLGAVAAGKRYIGQDLNLNAVEESNKIIEFLQLQNATISQKDIFESSGEYECMLTCPPYNDKELYNGEFIFLICDRWIDDCLKRFNCSRYVFVVDTTEKYKDYIAEELKSTSHFNTVKETVVVISK